MNTEELSRHQVEEIEDKVTFTVNETDNAALKSHAGIFISINNQNLVVYGDGSATDDRV